MSIAKHIETITSLDVEGLAKARHEHLRLERMRERLEVADLEPARKAGAAIKRHIRRRLEPHHVEFLGDSSGFAMFHAPARLTMTVRFEIWPRKPGSKGYAIPARPILSGSIGAKDADQMEALLAALKDAADRLADVLFDGGKDG